MTPSMDSSMESSPDLLELGTQDPPEMPEAQSSNAVSLQLSLVLLSRLCAGGMWCVEVVRITNLNFI
jgi:hypothetical protein